MRAASAHTTSSTSLFTQIDGVGRNSHRMPSPKVPQCLLTTYLLALQFDLLTVSLARMSPRLPSPLTLVLCARRYLRPPSLLPQIPSDGKLVKNLAPPGAGGGANPPDKGGRSRRSPNANYVSEASSDGQRAPKRQRLAGGHTHAPTVAPAAAGWLQVHEDNDDGASWPSARSQKILCQNLLCLFCDLSQSLGYK